MNIFIIYYVIGAIVLMIYQLIVNAIFKQRWSVIWKGFAIGMELLSMTAKVLYIVYIILAELFIILIWPVSLIGGIIRDYTQRELIKESIKLIEEL